MINSSRANLSLDLLPFFLQNDSLVFSSTSTFHLFISSVYFAAKRGDLLNLPKFYRASLVSRRAPTSKWLWLTDQSERAIYFCYVIRQNLLEVARTAKSCSKRRKLLKSCRAQSGKACSGLMFSYGRSTISIKKKTKGL